MTEDQSTAQPAGPVQVQAQKVHRVPSDKPFLIGFAVIGGSYVLLIVLMILADISRTSPSAMMEALADKNIQYSIKFSLISCTISAILAVWVAIPIAYLMSRFNFKGRNLLDAILDIPIVLPPLVIGISLLVLFNYFPSWISADVVLAKPAVIIAQFSVACAFAVRSLRITFDQIPQRYENVAMCLGCNRSQAFWRVVMPQARNGVVTALMLAWARSLGEFGPILVFAGSTRMYTEVLSTTVFLELQSGRMEAVTAVSLIMIFAAVIVLVCTRMLGMRHVE
ncbi:MAG: ABC transporter permease [Planctomycetes bacterium]|nr:ABC transporter permease [Planctomycetota bacterium]